MKKIIKFDDTEIEEYKFYQNKSPILIKDIHINKLVVSNNLPFGKQDSKDSGKISPLRIFHWQIIICKRNFDENKYIYFLIKKSFY